MTKIVRLRLPIIRARDIIRVNKPIFVIRVGYPKCIESETKIVLEKFDKQINELLDCEDRCRLVDDVYGNIRAKLARRIAYARLQLNGFGGRERKIYTNEIPELKGIIGYVCYIKYMKTGVYYPPCGYDEDYEPGGLENQKILMIYPNDNRLFSGGYDHLQIEACNVFRERSGFESQLDPD